MRMRAAGDKGHFLRLPLKPVRKPLLGQGVGSWLPQKYVTCVVRRRCLAMPNLRESRGQFAVTKANRERMSLATPLSTLDKCR